MEIDWKETQWENAGNVFRSICVWDILVIFDTNSQPKKENVERLKLSDGTAGPQKDLSFYCCTWRGILFHHSLAMLIFQPQIQNEKPLNSFQDLGTL